MHNNIKYRKFFGYYWHDKLFMKDVGLIGLRIPNFSIDTFGNKDYNIGKSRKEKYVFWIF